LSRLAALGLWVASCGVEESNLAKDAERQLVGLSQLDLHLCAGFPTKTETIEGVLLETYETTAAPPNMSVSLPAIGPLGGGGFGISGARDSYCRATFALVNRRVVALRYSGETGVGLGALARCGSIVQHCVADDRSDDQQKPASEAGGSPPGQPPEAGTSH